LRLATSTFGHKRIKPSPECLPPCAIGIVRPWQSDAALEFGPDFGERHIGGRLIGHGGPRELDRGACLFDTCQRSLLFAISRYVAF
jgi:hypothetical protein